MRSAVDELVERAVEVDPFADRVVGLMGSSPLERLSDDRHTRKRAVLAAMVEVQMAVDHRLDAVRRDTGIGQGRDDRLRRRLVLGEIGMALADAGVEQDPAEIGLDRKHHDDAALAEQRAVWPDERRQLDWDDAHGHRGSVAPGYQPRAHLEGSLRAMRDTVLLFLRHLGDGPTAGDVRLCGRLEDRVVAEPAFTTWRERDTAFERSARCLHDVAVLDEDENRLVPAGAAIARHTLELAEQLAVVV